MAQNTEQNSPLLQIEVKDGKIIHQEIYNSNKLNQLNSELHNSPLEKSLNPNKLNSNDTTTFDSNQSLVEIQNIPSSVSKKFNAIELNLEQIQLHLKNNKSKIVKEISNNLQVILNDNIDYNWPINTNWIVGAASNSPNAFWGITNSNYTSSPYSIWCAADGTDKSTPTLGYNNNMYNWAVYGPFDLSDAEQAKVSLKAKFNTEKDADFIGWYVSINGSNFYGSQYSGNNNTFTDYELDLNNVYNLGNICGEYNVWLAIIFQSNSSVTYEGAYIDDIRIEKHNNALADLVWTQIRYTQTPWQTGQGISFTLTEENLGEGLANAHRSQLYLSTDNIITDIDIVLGQEIEFNAINSENTQSQQISFNLSSIPNGEYYIGALVDINNDVQEKDEANNSGVANNKIGIDNLNTIDLYATAISLSSTIWSPNLPIEISLTEENNGYSTAGSHNTQLYLSLDTYINNNEDIKLDSPFIYTDINPKSQQIQKNTITVPKLTTPDGLYYICIHTDCYNEVIESNEDNNYKYRNSQIEYTSEENSDLSWSKLSFSSSDWSIGQTINFHLEEENSGNSDAKAHYSQLYISEDSIIDNNDIHLGEAFIVETILKESTLSTSGSFEVPYLMCDKTYYVGAIVDITNIVDESDETNNAGCHNSMINVNCNNLAPQIKVTPTVIKLIEPDNPTEETKIEQNKDNTDITPILIDGRPPINYRAPAIPEEELQKLKSISTTSDADLNILSNIPAFDWSYGCSATSAAMLAGYYDNNKFPNIYTGPINNGIVPLTNSIWGDGECPLSATHKGFDNLKSYGHVDDYWVEYGSYTQDPYITNGWSEHEHTSCTGDYMGTNQYKYGNTDGGTTFYNHSNGSKLYDYEAPDGHLDGGHGLKRFIESRGYKVSTVYNQLIMGYDGLTNGFTFEEFKEQIDKGNPVLVHVTGHTMLSYGYNKDEIYIHDTWDHQAHTMKWGDKYPYGNSSLQHYGVTVIELNKECEYNTFTIQNIGNSTLSIEAITTNKSWLIVNDNSESFNIAPSSVQQISIDIEWNKLPNFQSIGIITITSNDPDNPNIEVEVTAVKNSISIKEIQKTIGESDESPYNGQVVTTKGTVTLVVDQNTSTSIYIQDEEDEWNGIWAYDIGGITSSIQQGNNIKIKGTIAEYYGLTEITTIDCIELLSSNNAINPLTIDISDVNESYESVLVEFENIVCSHVAGSDGEWKVSDGNNELVVDDLYYAYLPILGEKFLSIAGIISYNMDEFKLQIRNVSEIKTIPTDISNRPFNSEIKLYPNPTSGIIKLVLNNTNIKPEFITINNAIGQRLKKINVNNRNQIEIDLSSLENGIYLIEVLFTNSSEVYKVVKK